MIKNFDQYCKLVAELTKKLNLDGEYQYRRQFSSKHGWLELRFIDDHKLDDVSLKYLSEQAHNMITNFQSKWGNVVSKKDIRFW